MNSLNKEVLTVNSFSIDITGSTVEEMIESIGIEVDRVFEDKLKKLRDSVGTNPDNMVKYNLVLSLVESQKKQMKATFIKQLGLLSKHYNVKEKDFLSIW